MFANPEDRLVPGLLVSFRVLTGERLGVIKVPVVSLIQKNGDFSVYVIEDDGSGKKIARLRGVKTGLRTTDEVEILSGLSEGESVVVFGQTRLDDGSLVKVISSGEGER
jgi:multidrug efflux pump subunit AcrA (membrane-fusion protein)